MKPRFSARLRSARWAAPAVVAVLAAASLAGCSTGSTDAKEEAPEQKEVAKAEAGAFPVTIKHSYGETTVAKEPKRVLTVSWTDQDAVLALGVVPVGAVKLTWGGNEAGSTEWFDAKLEELDAEQPTRFNYDQALDLDAIAKLSPDVIIAANSGITKQDYAKLTKIAPTVAPPGAIWVTSWQDSLDIVGQVLGRNKLADQVEADTEKTIAEAKAANPDIQGKSVIFSYLNAADLSQVGIYLAEDNRVRILTELGMTVPPSVTKLKGTDPYYTQVSAERSSELTSDVFLTYVEQPTDLETFKKDKLVGQIPALKSGNVYGEIDKHIGLAITNPSPLSIPYLIEHFLPNVVKAATAS